MPIVKKRRARKSKNENFDESILEFFFTGETPDRGTPAWRLYTSRFFDGGAAIRDTWMRHRETILRKWKAEKHTGKAWGTKYDD